MVSATTNSNWCLVLIWLILFDGHRLHWSIVETGSSKTSNLALVEMCLSAVYRWLHNWAFDSVATLAMKQVSKTRN